LVVGFQFVNISLVFVFLVLEGSLVISVTLLLLFPQSSENPHVVIVILDCFFRIFLVKFGQLVGISLVTAVKLVASHCKRPLMILVVLNALVKQLLALLKPSYRVCFDFIVALNTNF